jgi:hypothetical protein
MALQQPCAITAYQHVVDSVPKWKSRISVLSEYAAEKHGEFVAEYSRLVHRVRNRKQKSASIASIRSDEEHESNAEPTNFNPPRSPQLSELADIDPMEAGNRFIYAQARRKRRPGTSLRSNLSGPRNVPRKQMVVIYYDAPIQRELEILVKELGSARNNLRKGKNAYIAEQGFTSALGKRYDSFDNYVHNPISKTHRNAPKSDFDFDPPSHADPTSIEAAFARTDKELDVIQSAAESAAHQMLRNGDCKANLTEALGKLNSLVLLAQTTLDKLKAEKAEATKHEDALTAPNHSSEHMSVQSTLCEKPSSEVLGLPKLLSPILSTLEDAKLLSPPPILPSVPIPLAADAIEVDEAEDESDLDIDLNISNYRAGQRIVA